MSTALRRNPINRDPATDDQFVMAVLAHKLGQAAGGLGLYEYSERNPDIKGDPVNGANLWTQFLTDNQEAYYIPKAEFELAQTLREKLPGIVTEPVVMAFLGPGNRFTFERKDRVATAEFKRVAGANVIDINSQFLTSSMEVIEAAWPSLSIGAFKRDMFAHHFSFPQITNFTTRRPTQLATMFGGTIVNGGVALEFGEPLLPEEQITARLASVRQSFGELGGYFVVTQDANTDQEKILNAYRGQTEFLKNLAHRIKRDTHFTNADAENAMADFRWHEEAKLLGHWLKLDFEGKGNPTEIMVESSPKIPTNLFLQWAANAGWENVCTETVRGVNAHVLHAAPAAGLH